MLHISKIRHADWTFTRSFSAFARCANQLVWPTLLNSPSWFHVTGITPLVSDPSRLSWLAAVQHAKSQQIPISLDLNHRKQLGGTKQNSWKPVLGHLVSHGGMIPTRLSMVSSARTACTRMTWILCCYFSSFLSEIAITRSKRSVDS